MASKYMGPIKWVGGTAVLLLIFGLLWMLVLRDALLSEEAQSEVLINAIPFLAIFIAILLTFILVIVLVAIRFNGKLPRRLYRPIEITVVAGIAASIVFLFQPWQLVNEQLGWVPAEILWMVAAAAVLAGLRSISALPVGTRRWLDMAVLAIIAMLFVAIIEFINDGIDFIPVYVLGGLALLLLLALLYIGENLPILEDYSRREHVIIGGMLVTLAVFFAVIVREVGWVPADVSPVKTVQNEVVEWLDKWQLIGFEYGFILLMFSTLSYILWSHIVPGSRLVDASLPPLGSRHHLIGLFLGLVVVVVVAGGLASMNQPSEPFGMRQRQFDTLSEEQQLAMADEADEDFIFIEIPFLIFVGLFPASIVYYVGREVSLAMEGGQTSRPVAQAMPGSESVTT